MKPVTFDSLLNHNVRKWANKVETVEWLKEHYMSCTDDEQEAVENFIHDAAYGIASGGMWWVYNRDIIDNFYLPYRDELKGTVLHHLHGREVADVRKCIRAGQEAEHPEFWPDICTIILKLMDEMLYSWANNLARKMGTHTERSYFERLN